MGADAELAASFSRSGGIAKPDAVERLAPDVVQPLRGIQHHVIKPVRARPVSGVCGEHDLPAEPASVAIPAAHHEAFAGGAGARIPGGIRTSQPDRET